MRSLVTPPNNFRGISATKHTGIVDVRPEWVNVDAASFQFKSNGDSQGVTDRLQGIKKFDHTLCGILMLWEDESGHLFVADGHQRMGLARRAMEAGQKDIWFPCRIYSEKDGISKEQVKIIAAYKNIAEGTGSAIDAARVLRLSGAPPDTLPPKSDLVKLAKKLAKLSDEFFEKISSLYQSPLASKLDLEHVGVIADLLYAETATIDNKPEKELAILNAFLKYEPESVTEARYMAEEVLNAGVAANVQQGSLFALEEVDDLLQERIEIRMAAIGYLKNERKTPRRLVKGYQDYLAYVDNPGALKIGEALSRTVELEAQIYILENFSNHHEFRQIEEKAASKFANLKSELAEEGEHSSYLREQLQKLDDFLTQQAKLLKAAKVKGDTHEITQVRAQCVKGFLEESQAAMANSEVAGYIRSGFRQKLESKISR